MMTTRHLTEFLKWLRPRVLGYRYIGGEVYEWTVHGSLTPGELAICNRHLDTTLVVTKGDCHILRTQPKRVKLSWKDLMRSL